MSVSPLVTNEAIKAANNAAFFGGLYHGWSPEAEAEHRTAQATAKAFAQASAIRLVQGSKSPTREAGRNAALFLAGYRESTKVQPPGREVAPSPEWGRDVKAPGTFAIFEHRQWSDEYRVRFETATPGGAAPDQTGNRETERLTHRGARKIADSCFYMSSQRGGFSTFLTLTLTEEARAKLATVKAVPRGELVGGFVVMGPDHERERTRDTLKASQEQYQTQQHDNETGGPFVALDPASGRPFSPVEWSHVWSIQREASRFFDALQVMYKRGWQYQTAYTRHRTRKNPANDAPFTPLTWAEPQSFRLRGSRALYCVEGDAVARGGAPYTAIKWWREPLDYMWVAEAPPRKDQDGNVMANADGVMLTNPHLHVLMRWRVDYRDFYHWAKRIEKLWGQGTAHLEKIKEPEAAGAYMAKAAGYLTKGEGQDNSQGTIRGNRYGISARARAPAWACLERSQVGILGCLMAEAGEHWKTAYGPLVRERDQLKERLSAEVQGKQRQQIGRILEGVRGKIQALPRVSKYAAILKGEKQYRAFREWAESQEAANGPDWLPKKEAGEGFRQEKGKGIWFAEFRARQWFRRNGRRLRVTDDDFAAWFALIDGGGVILDENERVAA